MGGGNGVAGVSVGRTNGRLEAGGPGVRGGVELRGDEKFRVVAGFARSMLGDVRHERRVAGLAARLFAMTADWHGLADSDVQCLRLGALLHDIGRAEDDELHPEVGAAIIKRARRLPLTARERRAVMFMTRYHRGAVPREGHDELLGSEILRQGEYPRVVALLSLLRAADAMDSRSAGGADVTFERRGRKIAVTLTPHNDTTKARKALARRKKFRLMEELLGCAVRVRVV